MQGVAAAKKEIRKSVLSLRDALGAEQRARISAAITERLLTLPSFAAARTVAAYLSFGSEFDTAGFVSAVLVGGKHLALPRVRREGHEMRFHFVAGLHEFLLPGPWGIREPDPAHCPEADFSEIDLVLVPGVAFPRRCERLGYGGGFYDGAIGAMRADVATVAPAFSLQIVEALPLEAHDRQVDMVVTEQARYVRNE